MVVKKIEDHHRDAKQGVNGKVRHVSNYRLDMDTLKGKGHYLVADHKTAIPVPGYPGLVSYSSVGLATYLVHRLGLSQDQVNKVIDKFRASARKAGINVDYE